MTPLPILSEAVAKSDVASELVQIWKQRIHLQTEEERAAARKAPKTVLSIVPSKMKELLSDSANPLCDEEFGDLATEFIFDHVSKHSFDSKSPDLIEPEGLALKTLSGRKLIFMRNVDSGKYRVNDIEVASVTTLSDGTVAISIKDFIFGYESKIKEAVNDLKKEPGLKSRFKAFFKRDNSDDEKGDDDNE